MANALYRQLSNNEYMRQDGGGPIYFKIVLHSDGLWYPQFTYDYANWIVFFPIAGGFATSALAQTALDKYIGQLNAGTA